MIRDGKPIEYSGQGNTAGNLIAVAVPVALFLGGLYMLNFLDFGSVWIPMGGLIVLGSIAYLIPKQIIGQSNTVDHEFITDPAHETNKPNL